MDNVNPSALRSIISQLYGLLKKNNELEAYEFVDDMKFISVDGVHYYSSEKVHCSGCLIKKHSSGTKSYHHSMLAAVMVYPDQREVFPMDCEPIINEDGNIKNDCELNASKRLLSSLLSKYRNENFLLLGDALYAVNPLIKQILANIWHFILGIKPKKHKVSFSLMEGRKERNQLKTFTVVGEGKTHTYIFLHEQCPIKRQKDTEMCCIA